MQAVRSGRVSLYGVECRCSALITGDAAKFLRRLTVRPYERTPHTINTPKPYTRCYRFELARTGFDLRSSCFFAQVFNGLRGGHPDVESECAGELTQAEGRFGGQSLHTQPFPGCSLDFALTLAAEIAGATVAQTIQLLLEYAPAPPFNSGTPETAPPEIMRNCRRWLSERDSARG
jgi:hypothetical protein